MFNWFSAPTFASMLLFWVLGAYVLTRSPRSAVSLTAVGAQFATALYLLGQLMVANAETLEQWMPWERNLVWAAHVAPFLWYLLTLLLLKEQGSPRGRMYVHFVGYPFFVIHALATVFFVAAAYGGEMLNRWSAVRLAEPAEYSRFELPNGPLFIGFVVLLVGLIALLMGVTGHGIGGRRHYF